MRRGYAQLANQLAHSKSPYLRAHANNPVAWQQWKPETWELARSLQRPVFLSSGFSACHWCHVMNRTEFSQPKVAELLHTQFVPIKIDREERPDVDFIYMLWLQARTGGQAGWPLNMFLEPGQLQAFFGGTYWSKEATGISFVEVLEAAAAEWKNRQDVCLRTAQNISDALRNLMDSKTGSQSVDVDLSHIAAAVSPDAVWSETSDGPRFVMPAMVEALGSGLFGTEHQQHAINRLHQASRSGLHDHVHGGLHRYAVKPDWLVPHFEKTLVDQTLTLRACLNLVNDPEVLDLAHDLADFLVDGPLVAKQGGWYSTIDADSDGQEGAFYVWTAQDFRTALAKMSLIDRDMAELYFGVTPEGNWETGINVLSRATEPAEVAKTFGRSIGDVNSAVSRARSLLKAARPGSPSVDTKQITGWNGLAIGALARASQTLGRPILLEQAVAAANLFWNAYERENLLPRVLDTTVSGVCEDYAYFIEGLLDVFEVTGDDLWRQRAEKLQSEQTARFADPRGGYWLSTAPELWLRPKSGFDASEPNYQGVTVGNLRRLGLEEEASRIVTSYSEDIAAQPAAYFTMIVSAFK